MLILLISGLFAGMLHVISGPDHLGAIAPLVVKRPRRSWITGIRWGLGHTAGVVLVGLLALLLRDLFPLERLSIFSERLVGFLLLALGFWGIRKALQIHSHEHQHGEESHEHIHIHGPGQHRGHAHFHAAFGIGTLHGLAGGSHFLGVLPALALPTKSKALLFLASFGAGTILAMMFFSLAVGAVAVRFSTRQWKAYRAMMLGTSLAALAIGGFWILQ